MSLAEAITNHYLAPIGTPHPVEGITLIPGRSASYEIIIDGTLVYSKLKTKSHISNEDAISLIESAVSGS